VRSALLFVLCMSMLVLAQQPSSKEPAQAKQGKAVPPGQKIFEENCMRCHAVDGSSNTFIGHRWKIPDLRSDAVQKLSPEQRIEIITEGKERMPAQKNKLTADEIRRVESYVRELGKKPSTSVK
jgi:cytochrome c6